MRGVKRFKSKGIWYCYHRKSGKRIESEFGSAEFFLEVAALDERSKIIEPRAGSLGKLFAAYKASEKFRNLAPRTQTDYNKVIDWLARLDGMPVAMIDAPFARNIRDRASKTKGFRFANYVQSVLSAALTWAADYGHVEKNEIKGQVSKVKRPKDMRRRNRPWTKAEREIAIREAPFHLKVPLALMRWAGFRTGDALAMPRTAYDGTAIEIRTGKTGQLVWMPCPKPLRPILDRAKQGEAITLATTSNGVPWTGNGFRSSLAKFLKKLQGEGKVGAYLSPHGLRHSVAIDLREMGYHERDIADFLGQAEIETARSYARGADLRKKNTAIVRRMDRKS